MTNSGKRTRRLWRLPRLARLFAVALVLLCGCRSVRPGVVVEHRPGDCAQARPVPYAATYTLQSVDDGGTAATLLERADIQHKFQVGFVRQADGTLAAYAGGRKFPLPEGHYVWQIAPESVKTRERPQVDARNILVAVGAAVVCAGVIVLGAALILAAGMAGGSGGPYLGHY